MHGVVIASDVFDYLPTYYSATYGSTYGSNNSLLDCFQSSYFTLVFIDVS